MFFCADTAACLNLQPIPHQLLEQLDILQLRSGGAEAGGGFDIVRTAPCYTVAESDLFFVGQVAGLHDDFQHTVGSQLTNGADLRHHFAQIAALHIAHVDHQIQLVGAVLTGIPSLGRFRRLSLIAQREADDGADLQLRKFLLGFQHIAGRDADGGAAMLQRFLTQLLDLRPCGGGFQQGMIDMR